MKLQLKATTDKLNTTLLFVYLTVEMIALRLILYLLVYLGHRRRVRQFVMWRKYVNNPVNCTATQTNHRLYVAFPLTHNNGPALALASSKKHFMSEGLLFVRHCAGA